MSLIFLVNGPCLRDNSPEWFTQTICSIERKMPYTNAIWGVLLEKNYWIYDLNFPFKQNEDEKNNVMKNMVLCSFF